MKNIENSENSNLKKSFKYGQIFIFKKLWNHKKIAKKFKKHRKFLKIYKKNSGFQELLSLINFLHNERNSFSEINKTYRKFRKL